MQGARVSSPLTPHPQIERDPGEDRPIGMCKILVDLLNVKIKGTEGRHNEMVTVRFCAYERLTPSTASRGVTWEELDSEPRKFS